MEVETPEGETACGLPEFPEDSDEKITVLFRLSLNEFVKIASAVDVGSDIAYGADGLKIWWLWVANIMCASFCEEMAECINDPDSAFTQALIEQINANPALAGAIADAMAKTGAAVPGRSLTPGQSATSILPPAVFDEFGECIPDALWGAILYLVQSGNRAITDLNEILESLSNTLETSAIISQTIPAAGQYVSAAAEFADQMRENIAEGYAAAYTEAYETDLACDIFCAAMENCELTPDMLVDIMAARMPDPIDVASFGLIMATVGTIIIPPESIADSAFLVYFSALKFGQQYGEVVGIRPLTDLMGLGADQLASDNWETLCDCAPPEGWSHDIDFTGASLPDGWTVEIGTHTPGVGIAHAGTVVRLKYTFAAPTTHTEIIVKTAGYPAGAFVQVWNPYDDGSHFNDNFNSQASPGDDAAVVGLPSTFVTPDYNAGFFWSTGGATAVEGLHVEGEGFDPYA